MQKLTAMFNIFVGIFQRGCCTIRKSDTHTNAPHRHNTPQTTAIEVHEGQAAAARLMAVGVAASSRITAILCVGARGGQICGLTLRQHLEKKCLVPISA